jgi:hypothetical protein
MLYTGCTMKTPLKKYFLRMTIGMIGYVLGICAWLYFYKESSHKFWPIIFPILPLLYVCTAIVRFISEGLDEMQRKIQIEAMAFSGLATGFTCLSYVFVAVTGGPYFRPDWAFYMVWIYYWIGFFFSRRRYK